MMLIDADALYERACELQAQALDCMKKLKERDGGEISIEWRMWSVALMERTAFKYDVFDAPTVDAIPRDYIEEWKKGKTGIEQMVADKIIMDYLWDKNKGEE